MLTDSALRNQDSTLWRCFRPREVYRALRVAQAFARAVSSRSPVRGTAEVEQVRGARQFSVRQDPRLEPRTALAQGRDLSTLRTMKAVVNASATAAGASLGPSNPLGAGPLAEASASGRSGRGSETQAASLPRTGTPVRGSTMWSPLRTPEALSAVWRIERRESTRTARRDRSASAASRRAPGRVQGEDREAPWTSARSIPLLEQFRHQIGPHSPCRCLRGPPGPRPSSSGPGRHRCPVRATAARCRSRRRTRRPSLRRDGGRSGGTRALTRRP